MGKTVASDCWLVPAHLRETGKVGSLVHAKLELSFQLHPFLPPVTTRGQYGAICGPEPGLHLQLGVLSSSCPTQVQVTPSIT